MHFTVGTLLGVVGKRQTGCRRYARALPDGTRRRRISLYGSPVDDSTRARLVEAGRTVGEHAVSVSFGDLQVCGYWHSCLICGAKIALHRAATLEHIFRVAARAGCGVVMATMTSRHTLGVPLEAVLDAQTGAWKAVRSDRPWKRDKEALGILWVIPCLEVTHGDKHGWHPHRHVYLITDRPATQAEAQAGLEPAWQRWADAHPAGLRPVARVRSTATGELESAGFDVKVMGMGPGAGESSASLGLYPFKAALEGVGGVFKSGRELPGDRHRTIFEVLEYLAAFIGEGATDSPHYQRDVAIVGEFTTTMRKLRLRQVRIEPALKRWAVDKAREFGITGPLWDGEEHDVLEDQAVAEVSPDDADRFAMVCPQEYRRYVIHERDTLRAAGLAAGHEGIRRWFDQRGLILEEGSADEGTGVPGAEAPGDPRDGDEGRAAGGAVGGPVRGRQGAGPGVGRAGRRNGLAASGGVPGAAPVGGGAAPDPGGLVDL